jgi:uncharacterized Fe-S cluster-containing radical SAM superfamily protein
MGIMGVTTGQDGIHFGTRGDVCTLCVREKAQKEFMSFTEANRKLLGTFERKRLLKIPVSGTQVIICMDHIHKLSSDNREVATDAE